MTVSKGRTVARRGCVGIPMRIVRVGLGLSGLLVSCQMFLLAVLFGNAVGVCGAVLQLRSALVVFVRRHGPTQRAKGMPIWCPRESESRAVSDLGMTIPSYLPSGKDHPKGETFIRSVVLSRESGLQSI
jgi:hypothetical protein